MTLLDLEKWFVEKSLNQLYHFPMMRPDKIFMTAEDWHQVIQPINTIHSTVFQFYSHDGKRQFKDIPVILTIDKNILEMTFKI